MKKKLPYFLFPIIVLVGLFSPIISVHAQVTPEYACGYFLQTNGPLYPRCVETLTSGKSFTTPDGGKINLDGSTEYKGNKTPALAAPAKPAVVGPSKEAGGSWDCIEYNEDGSCANPATIYHLLEPLPCANGTAGCKITGFNPDAEKNPNALGTYLNIMIRLFIGLCAVLAVVMIVIGGIEYSTSELVSSKEAGKDRIRDALLGLLLALGAWLILFTVNPDLLNTDVGGGSTKLGVTPQTQTTRILPNNPPNPTPPTPGTNQPPTNSPTPPAPTPTQPPVNNPTQPNPGGGDQTKGICTYTYYPTSLDKPEKKSSVEPHDFCINALKGEWRKQ